MQRRWVSSPFYICMQTVLVLCVTALLAARDASEHWAYVAPTRGALPSVADKDWPRGAIDRFVLARLESEGLQPSGPASRARLIRRLYLDLIGLPPSVEEVDAFLADDSAVAYDRVVDRLLASPRYGEHWARLWLDLARHADSNGFQADQYREVWLYRDWVIRALNRDMPFDQFTIEQLAGDLFPDATLDQKIATGFHRNTTCNVEGGVVAEHNRLNQVIDRVNTTATVWLGTTFECAQCHEHKNDPFTQYEYYQLFAFFNNSPMETKPRDATTSSFFGPKLWLPVPLKRETEWQRVRKLHEETAKEFVALKEEIDKEPANNVESIPKKERLEQLQKKRDKLAGELEHIEPTSALVMVEMEEKRQTRVFTRGNFLTPGEEVKPRTPPVLHPFSSELPPNRLGLARWLVDRRNPLVARVTVNRWWAVLFGRGLVATAEDFGTQGEPPTHKGLLDHLAVEFMECGWSMKHMHRLIVTSATYRQSSRIPPERLEHGPRNELLSYGPRFRLAAESVRDNALAISGLLSTKIGGPPVYPPQPDGVWRHLGRNQPKYILSEGEDRFRRGVYVIWRRSAPYVSFVNFDAPMRTSCVVDRPRTNTPLQALTLLNDPAYVEMAWGLARRILRDRPGGDMRERVSYGFRLCLARAPNPEEKAHLIEVHEQELVRFRESPETAHALLGEQAFPSGLPEDIDASELASWFFVANILLNLDETITRG